MASPDVTTPTKPKRAAARRKRATSRARARPAATTSTRPQTRSERAQALAERVVLIPVGAALKARDRVAGSVDGLVTATRSRSALEKQLDRFERRGGSARTQLEREVRRTRTRIERRGRGARRGIDRQREQARKVFDTNVGGITGRVENVVQNGVDAGMKLVNGAQDRLAKVV